MKTLVIHPKDETTDFLSKIYEGKGFTVVIDNISTSKLKNLISENDRIIMLGHGTPKGLLGYGRNIIDSNLVYLLKSKICISIWCFADVFVKKYKLRGFYTSMFISEIYEASYEGFYNISQNEIDSSNNNFSNVLSKYLDDNDILEKVKLEYGSSDSEIVKYNCQGLGYNNIIFAK